MTAKLIENWDYIVVALLVGIIVTILTVKVLKSKAAQKAEAGAKAMTAHVKAAVEKHLHHGPAELVVEHPFVADHPAVPASDAQQKSAPAAPAVAWSDRVAAKHAALDKRIADGQAAQVEKDALTVLQANLDKLTAGA